MTAALVLAAVLAVACVLALLWGTDLVPAWGQWYSVHELHRLQSLALLEGRLAWTQEPQGDAIWGPGGTHTNFGLGVPLLALPFDAVAARAFGRVAASLRKAGRKPSARAYDAMIAATALANSLPVYTCNPVDFAGIDGLTVVPVPVPQAP